MVVKKPAQNRNYVQIGNQSDNNIFVRSQKISDRLPGQNLIRFYQAA
jgi:hypothetical protein